MLRALKAQGMYEVLAGAHYDKQPGCAYVMERNQATCTDGQTSGQKPISAYKSVNAYKAGPAGHLEMSSQSSRTVIFAVR